MRFRKAIDFICTKPVMVVLVLFLTACEAPDPETRRAALHLPPPGFKGNSTEGRNLFVSNCSSCHGNNAQGTEQGPSLIDNVYRNAHHADFAFHMAVRDGVRQHHWGFGDMPAVPKITAKETAHVIAYIRQEQSKAGITN